MKREVFIQGSTRTRILEKKLLTKEQIQRLIDAKNLEEAGKILLESGYQKSFSKLQRLEDYEKALEEEQNELYATIREISPSKAINDFLMLKYDIHNLKVLFKDHIMGTNSEDLLIKAGSLKLDEIKARIDSGDRLGLDKELRGMASGVADNFLDTKDPQIVELVIDLHYYLNRLKLAEEIGEEVFINYVKDNIDFTNFKNVLRMKSQNKPKDFVKYALIDGGFFDKDKLEFYYHLSMGEIIEKFKGTRIYDCLVRAEERYKTSQSLSEFEKAMDNHKAVIIEKAKRINYGPEVIFAYALAKEMEIKNLRVILISKLNNLSESFIKERMSGLNV